MKVRNPMSEPIVKLELYLVRHGQSMAQLGQSEEGLPPERQGDPSLSPKGFRQAQLLGEYLSDLPFDHILASGLCRAANTAHEVCIRQPENGAKCVEVHKVFTECGTGEDCVGRTVEQIHAQFPTVVAAEGMKEGEKVVFHGKDDTDEQLLERGKEAIDYLLKRFHKGERVMVAAHAAFNTFMLFAALGLSHEQVFDPAFENTSITKIVFFEPGTARCADTHLIYHNALPHLIEEMPEFRY